VDWGIKKKKRLPFTGYFRAFDEEMRVTGHLENYSGYIKRILSS